MVGGSRRLYYFYRSKHIQKAILFIILNYKISWLDAPTNVKSKFKTLTGFFWHVNGPLDKNIL